MGDVAENDEIKRLIPVVNKLQDAVSVARFPPYIMPRGKPS